MERTPGRKLSLIVAGVDILIAVGAIVARHGQFAGALFSLILLLWSLSFVWFPVRVVNFGNYLRLGFVWGYDLDPSVISLSGWVLLVTAVPLAAILIP